MSLESFRRNLRGVNEGEDFPVSAVCVHV